MWRAALGRVPLGGTGLVDPQAGLDQVWEGSGEVWALVWLKSCDLSKTGLKP